MTEPNDEAGDERRVFWQAYEACPGEHLAAMQAGLRAVSERRRGLDGFEISRLNYEVEALKAERDKLHAALGWMFDDCDNRVFTSRSIHADVGSRRVNELHDGTPAGRAAALVRLFERCTDGK